MHSPKRIGAVGALAAAALALAAGSASAATPHHDGFAFRDGEQLFVQTDNPAGNTVSVYDRAFDGSLTAAGSYATGGLGGVLDGSVVDHLASQGSLVYDGPQGLLFAVNAGSDTVSVFAVRTGGLALVQVISSGGSFPVSLALHGNLLYVVNALDGGSLQGYVIAADRLVALPGSSRSLGLADVTGPTQYVNTPGEVAFTPDGSKLIVTTKANGSDIDVFAVNGLGEPSPTPVINSEPGAVPFGFVFDSAGRFEVAEAGPDAVASFALAWNGTVDQITSLATGQAATCWIIADGSLLFASNAGSPSLSTISLAPWGGLTLLANTTTDAGTVDAATSRDGRFLYVQTGGAGIVDEFGVGFGGSLSEIGSVTVPGAVGGEGIAAS